MSVAEREVPGWSLRKKQMYKVYSIAVFLIVIYPLLYYERGDYLPGRNVP